MATNNYFNNYPTSQITSEQLLVEDLVIEAMQIYGMDVYYLPRGTRDQVDYLFGEDTLKQYVNAYPIEMYLENVMGMEGEQDFISKFGLEIRDEVRMLVSRRRFAATINQIRPNEGDLIWIPLTGSFHEIRFVEHEQPFYQLGNIYTYKLQTETFEFSHEKFSTGNEEIDSIEDTYQFAQRVLVSNKLNNFIFTKEEDVQQLIGYDEDNDPIYMYGKIGDAYYKLPNSQNELYLVINNIRASDGELKYFATSGTGSAGLTRKLVGLKSGAEWLITEAEEPMANVNDPGADNKTFETEGDQILDFTETNPFGEP